MEYGKEQPEVGRTARDSAAAVVLRRKHYTHTTRMEVGQSREASSIPGYWGQIQVPMEVTFQSKN